MSKIKLSLYLFLFSFTSFSSFATTYTGSATLIANNQILETNHPMEVILNISGDSASFIIPNLIIIGDESTNQVHYIGNLNFSKSKTFNLRGINAIASNSILTHTTGDLLLEEGHEPYFWIADILPDANVNIAALYDENDLILSVRVIDILNNGIDCAINFSTSGSNVPVIRGDINRDGVITGSDISELYNILLNY